MALPADSIGGNADSPCWATRSGDEEGDGLAPSVAVCRCDKVAGKALFWGGIDAGSGLIRCLEEL